MLVCKSMTVRPALCYVCLCMLWSQQKLSSFHHDQRFCSPCLPASCEHSMPLTTRPQHGLCTRGQPTPSCSTGTWMCATRTSERNDMVQALGTISKPFVHAFQNPALALVNYELYCLVMPAQFSDTTIPYHTMHFECVCMY